MATPVFDIPGIINEPLEELETKDIYFAAALHSLSVEYIGVDDSDKMHQRFKFKGKCLKQLERDWVNNMLTGNLPMFADSIRKFKAILHSQDKR